MRTIRVQRYVAIVLTLSFGIAACGKSSRKNDVGGQMPVAPAEASEFTKAALIRAAGECALGRYTAFAELAQALSSKVSAYAASRNGTTLDQARAAWRAAMASWQEAELFQFGPAARAMNPGGKDLRDNIYAWPLVSRCKIEEQLVSQAYVLNDFPNSLITGRTLAALEYLLFYEGTDNACSSFSTINAQGTWAALDAETLADRKADYAAAVAADVHARAGALVQAWSAEGGNFLQQLTGAGQSGTTFTNEQAALNAISDAMFYIEKEVKDLKLGKPLGLIECSTATCPNAVESSYARVSTENVRANLLGFRRLFEGCDTSGDALGFDDWLRAIGSSDLAGEMVQSLSMAIEAAEALAPPLEEAIISDVPKVQTVHTALKQVTDLLKAEFVSVLNLDLPKVSEGDND